MDKTLLISSADRQIRAALLEGQELIEFFIDQESSPSLVGNIYRGMIEDIVPGLEAAFVNIGMERKAFLHFADLIPEALEIGKRKKIFTDQVAGQLEAVKAGAPQSPTAPAIGPRGRKGGHPRHNAGPKTDWAKILSPKTPAMIQVMKDGFGEKAPRITTNISLPGRLMVLLPFPTQSGGISKKISSPQERQRLKRILKALGAKNASFIIRTAGMTATDDELENDATELKHQWQTILRRYRASKSEKLLHDDQNIFIRLARDVLTPEVTRIIVDDPQAAKDMKGALEYAFPDKAALVTEYAEELPLFDKFDVTKMVRRAVAPKVWLRKGGQIVIDETEALTTIDINSGRFISKENQEKTILETNLEACRTIAQHIRLRDLSGIIIIDFIDMLQESSRQKVEAEFRRWLRRDRAKMAVSGFSDFGIFLLTRKRRRTSLMQQMTQSCPYCEGAGRLMHKIEIWRNIKQAVLQAAPALKKRKDSPILAIMVHPQMAAYVREKFEDVLEYWKRDFGVEDIIAVPMDELHLEDFLVQPLEKKSGLRAALQLKARPRQDAATSAGTTGSSHAAPAQSPAAPSQHKPHEPRHAAPPHRPDKHGKPLPHPGRRDERPSTRREAPRKPEPPAMPDSIEEEIPVELDIIAETEQDIDTVAAAMAEGGAPPVSNDDQTVASPAAEAENAVSPADVSTAGSMSGASGAAAASSDPARKRRRGRRGGRGRRRSRIDAPIDAVAESKSSAASGSASDSAPTAGHESHPVIADAPAAAAPEPELAPAAQDTSPAAATAAAKKKAASRRGRRGGRGRKKPGAAA